MVNKCAQIKRFLFTILLITIVLISETVCFLLLFKCNSSVQDSLLGNKLYPIINDQLIANKKVDQLLSNFVKSVIKTDFKYNNNNRNKIIK